MTTDSKQQTVKISVESKKDGYGRQHFTAYWRTPEGTKRAQCFHADVEKHIKYWEKEASTVLVSDLF